MNPISRKFGKREKKSWTIWEVKIVIEILLSPLKLAIFNVHGHIIDNKNGLTRQQKTDHISSRILSIYAKQLPIGLASFREVTCKSKNLGLVKVSFVPQKYQFESYEHDRAKQGSHECIHA